RKTQGLRSEITVLFISCKSFNTICKQSCYLGSDHTGFSERYTENDLITIDVAPMIQSGWGDMARSFVVEEGKIIPWRQSQNQEIIEGMEMELKLHRLFMDSVNEKTTFEDLHHLIDEEVKKAGYCNCDYHGNYGHTIENDAKDRVTIDKGVSLAIAAYDKPITFEPHICKMNGRFGLKHEIMYAFIDGKMEVIG
ncbi:MAG: M24 family metallopeptidase, partial [Erysipelotrichaceae bacterium]|nr:M24 family metallopeptidase [Erysipelotrichaceae bacterium]